VADIRSAAGEGSEPRVPNQAQPAQELANLIAQSSAQSDAKGKGFWRRRRRKSATPPEPPAPAKASTPEAEKPATDETPTQTTDEPTSAAEEQASVTDEPTPDEADDQSPGTASDQSSEAAEDESSAAVEDQSSDAADEAAAEAATQQHPKSADEPAPDAVDAKPAEGAVAPAAKSTDDPPAAPVRPAVGVVYEPDESPDGFPLEYGNIIVGLPKSEKSDEPAEATAENSAAEATEAAPETGDAEATEASTEQSAEDADEQSSKESAEDGPAADATATEAAADDAGAPGESAEDSRADSRDSAEAADQPEATADESAEPAAEQAPESERPADESSDSTPAVEDDAAESDAAEGDAAEGDAPEADAAEPSTEATVDEPTADAAVEALGEAAADAAAEDSSEAAEAEAASSDQAGGAAQAEGAKSAAKKNKKRAAAEAHAAAETDAGANEESAETAAEAPPAGAAGQASDEAADAPRVDDSSDADDAPEVDGSSEAAGAAVDGSSEAGDAAADGSSEAADGGSAEADDSAAEESGEPAAEEAAAEAAADSSEEPGAAEQEAAGQVEEVRELTAEELAERLAAEQAAMALITALMKLRGALAAGQLPLDVVGADEARQQQKAMLDQLDDYLLPRLVQLEAPVLAVVGGSTGAGKSTLVNTVIGKVVSEPGVLRPTTRSPVLIHHPADADWFVGDRVLPRMARTSSDRPGGTEDAGQLRLVAADTVPRGLAILDAPDIDSVVEANRDLATQLLAAADLWLFVTTAARYSDAVPWDFLQSASDRSTAIAVVLDRAPGETIDDITGHLAQMLLERGLGDSPLFSIQETVVDGNGMLPAETVASIKDWLIDLAADAEARSAVVRRTLQGAVSAMVKTTPPFAAAVRAQADTAIELRSTAEAAYDQAVKDIAKATQDGTLLRGEVLARWQEFVGTGELLKGLQTNVGRMRDKVKKSLANQPAQTRDVSDAIESGLESLLREQAAAAAERAEKAWRATAAGRQLLAAGGPELAAMSEDFPAAAGRTVREWQASVLDLVRKEGADKRSTARILEYGVNGLGLSLMVVLFASGAGIPKAAEASAGVGSAVVGQKLLEAVFGDTAVRSLVEKAHEDLDGKVHALMDAEFARYLAVLDQHPVDSETARQLTDAARAVEDCT
jgi:ribosomal protein L29